MPEVITQVQKIFPDEDPQQVGQHVSQYQQSNPDLPPEQIVNDAAALKAGAIASVPQEPKLIDDDSPAKPANTYEDQMAKLMDPDEIASLQQKVKEASHVPVPLRIMQFLPRFSDAASSIINQRAATAETKKKEILTRLQMAKDLRESRKSDRIESAALAKEGREATDWGDARVAKVIGADPNSAQAKLYRNAISKMAPDQVEALKNMGADQLKEAGKYIQGLHKTLSDEMMAKARLDETRAYHGQMIANRGEAMGEKQDKQLEKRYQDAFDRMTPNRRNPLLTKLQTQINQADALEALVVSGGKLVNTNPQQAVEAARMLDSLLSQGGAGSVTVTNELVPKSVGRNSAEIMQWITNKPQGTNQQAFMKYMLDTARREKGVREDQLKQAQASYLPQMSDLKEKDPEKYNAFLEGLGFDATKDFDEKGHYVKKSGSQAAPQAEVKMVGGVPYEKRSDGLWYPKGK